MLRKDIQYFALEMDDGAVLWVCVCHFLIPGPSGAQLAATNNSKMLLRHHLTKSFSLITMLILIRVDSTIC